ncbi:uncharacterized protein F5147DRAFT_762082 [Suillus discolor]|uniref:G domain-containing protein n=1 Tax=Suillus discolor TaxID=1912936 RepID=A0A9P7F4H7_9AGAM|nr:uncharacterized protein F5147DRAFT_762082 [Suillus discolor]KAG2104324.1 hypothetical protein F5147DRAFT_762082 [Suillus discolor]
MTHTSMTSYPLIDGIIVDFKKFKTNIESAEILWVGKSPLRIDERKGRKSLHHTFSPPMMLSPGDTFSLCMEYIDKCLCLEMRTERTILEADDILHAYSASKFRRAYIKIHKKIRIIINLSMNTTTETEQFGPPDESLELPPTTSEIARIHPRFRILIAGKTGVGKSTLTYLIFGVKTTIIAHDKPGEANIDHEFISPQDDRFVIHDSRGFEPGEEDNLKIVRDFIERRRNMSPEHQLHAIWLCFEIPRAGGRLLETGTEEFLTWARNGMLGNGKRTSIDGLSNKAIEELVKKKAEAELEDTCIGPLNQFAGPDIPHVTTSGSCMPLKCNIAAAIDYEETLTDLIQITENCVAQHSASEAAVMTSFRVAQRVHPGLKIEASIMVGKMRYRKTLSLCTIFMKHKMRDCLYVLHTDIVMVWNFHDPSGHLHSPEFREMMMKMVEVGSTKGYRHFSLGHSVLQRFMTYIVDLTLVFQTLYAVSESQEVTRRAINLAVKSYIASPMSQEVRIRIQDYVRQLTILERMDRDTLDKVVEVMQFFSIDAVQVSELAYLSLDEPLQIVMSQHSIVFS